MAKPMDKTEAAQAFVARFKNLPKKAAVVKKPVKPAMDAEDKKDGGKDEATEKS